MEGRALTKTGIPTPATSLFFTFARRSSDNSGKATSPTEEKLTAMRGQEPSEAAA